MQQVGLPFQRLFTEEVVNLVKKEDEDVDDGDEYLCKGGKK